MAFINKTNIDILPNFKTNRKIVMDEAEVNSLLNTIFTTNFTTNVVRLFSSPVENIVSLRIYPFDVNRYFTTSNAQVIIGGYDTQLFRKRLNGYNKVLKIGEIEVLPYFNNFLDFEPYTRTEIYLPYIGIRKLNSNEIYAKPSDSDQHRIITIEYAIDFDTGNFTAFVNVGSVSAPRTKTILQENGRMGIDIPIGGRDFQLMYGKILNMTIQSASSATTSIATSLATQNYVGAGITAGSSAMQYGANLLANSAPNYERAGSYNGNYSEFFTCQNAYLILTRPNVHIPENYGELYGYPSMRTETLESLSGYTVVNSVHMEGFDNATYDEINEIETLLKNGIIL